jgi:hypothetical protein
MMENLDPEDKARFKQQMAMQQDPGKALGKLWGEVTGSGEEARDQSTKKLK